MEYLLSIIIFTPLVGACLILLTPNTLATVTKTIAVLTTAIVFALILFLYYGFATNFTQAPDYLQAFLPYDMQTFTEYKWISTFNMYYRLGVDGLSMVMLLLTGFLFFLAAFIAISIKKRLRIFFALYLLLLCSVLGIFVSLDLLLFYAFWMVMLIATYFLIGIWGGENKAPAATKFLVFMSVSSVLIFTVILVIYFKMVSLGLGGAALNIPEIIATQPFTNLSSDAAENYNYIAFILFWMLFIGFAIKMSVFPFHVWLPAAHVQAHTATSVVIAGVSLKIGSYGLLRLNIPIFREIVALEWVMFILALLGVITIIYGLFCAMGQKDLKSLIAYSSMSLMGYVMLGIATLSSIGINGAIFQMLAHALSVALMFALADILQKRAHHREINRLGGLAAQMPICFTIALIGFFAFLGMPALCGFVGEILVLIGAFSFNESLAIVATCGAAIAASYILYTLQRVFFGDKKEEFCDFKDCSRTELLYLVPLAGACIVFGVFPNLLVRIYFESIGFILGN